eukprot:Gb_40274 [translate_table: standard]
MATSETSVGGAQGAVGKSKGVNEDAKAPLWKYVIILSMTQGGWCKRWQCNECGKAYSGSYSRVKAHLLHITKIVVKVCPKVNHAKEAFIKEQEAAERASKRGSVNPFPKGYSSSMAPPFSQLNVDHAPRKRTKEMGQLEKMMDVGGREDVDSRVARCIYACGVSFNVVRSPYWQDMVRAINDGPKGYKTPSFEKVRTTLLTKEKSLVEQSIEPIRASWQTIGVSIVFDGWTDARNMALINVIVVCPKRSMFLKAVDYNGELKDATFIANILIDAIENVGPSNVVQVVTNNPRVCKATGLLVEARYNNIFWTPCAVNSLNLILKKIGKIEWIKKIIDEAKEIEMFITNHHMAQAIYQQFASLELLKVAETRFANHFIMLRRLLEVKSSLCNMVISDVWDIWRLSNTDRAQELKRTVLDDIWWGRV